MMKWGFWRGKLGVSGRDMGVYLQGNLLDVRDAGSKVSVVNEAWSQDIKGHVNMCIRRGCENEDMGHELWSYSYIHNDHLSDCNGLRL